MAIHRGLPSTGCYWANRGVRDCDSWWARQDSNLRPTEYESAAYAHNLLIYIYFSRISRRRPPKRPTPTRRWAPRSFLLSYPTATVVGDASATCARPRDEYCCRRRSHLAFVIEAGLSALPPCCFEIVCRRWVTHHACDVGGSASSVSMARFVVVCGFVTSNGTASSHNPSKKRYSSLFPKSRFFGYTNATASQAWRDP